MGNLFSTPQPAPDEVEDDQANTNQSWAMVRSRQQSPLPPHIFWRQPPVNLMQPDRIFAVPQGEANVAHFRIVGGVGLFEIYHLMVFSVFRLRTIETIHGDARMSQYEGDIATVSVQQIQVPVNSINTLIMLLFGSAAANRLGQQAIASEQQGVPDQDEEDSSDDEDYGSSLVLR